MSVSNEQIKVSDLQKISQSINAEWRNCDRNGKQFFQ